MLASTYFPGQLPAKYRKRHVSLTSVFGMGTGGPSPLKTPTAFGTNQILQYCALFVKSIFEGEEEIFPFMVHLQGLEPWTP